MNQEDQFEQRLRHQQVKTIPPAWRDEILNSARQAKTSRHSLSGARRSNATTLIQKLSTYFRPQRAAWTGLAGVWVVIFALNIAARDGSSGARTSRAHATVSPDTLQALKQQRLLLAELAGRAEPRAMDRPKTSNPGPRSQRREERLAG